MSANDKRLYVAGPEWTWAPGQTNGQSVIQVVDIADPSGKLSRGADVSIAGQISYGSWSGNECGKSRSGIQIIDSPRTARALGAAPLHLYRGVAMTSRWGPVDEQPGQGPILR